MVPKAAAREAWSHSPASRDQGAELTTSVARRREASKARRRGGAARRANAGGRESLRT
jgi:hypothetical protein